MLKSGIKLDRIEVGFRGPYANVDRISGVLDALHVRGFYKQLYVRVAIQSDQQCFNRIASLHGLEGLALFYWSNVLSVQIPLPNLKVAFFWNCDHSHEEELTNNLINIQRITFERASIGSILPFVRRCPRLNRIRILEVLDGDYIENGIIDLLVLNNERKKLAYKRKITIFVAEHILLTNKWNQSINLSFIKLDRCLAWQRTNPFIDYM